MSRGLGKLQSEILGSLDTSKEYRFVPYYWGGENADGKLVVRTTVRHHGQHHELPDDVFDLRAVKKVVALLDRPKRTRSSYQENYTQDFYYDFAFETAFYRAVRSLGERGWLEEVFFTVTDSTTAASTRVGQRIRFVSRPKCSVTLLNTYKDEAA